MAGDRRISRPDSSLPDWHIPDASYRPIPITWFAGAFIVQGLLIFAITILLRGMHPGITMALATIVTYVIGRKTWQRGMKDAAEGWKAATVVVLLLQLAFFVLHEVERL